MSTAPTYRTAQIDPDYRRMAKSNTYCEICQRDLAPETRELWIAHELDMFTTIIHPEDLAAALTEIRARRDDHLHLEAVVFDRVGPECAKKVPAGFVMTAEDKAAAVELVYSGIWTQDIERRAAISLVHRIAALKLDDVSNRAIADFIVEARRIRKQQTNRYHATQSTGKDK